MRVVPTAIPDVKIVELDVFEDLRGQFFERFNERKFAELGMPTRFVQDNQSYSRANVLRGLHYQLNRPQGKLVQCTRGSAWDVAVDVRAGSPTFRKWVGVELSESRRQLFWIPPGFAHGFCVLGAEAELQYKCTDFFDATDDRGIAWDDPELAIRWPVREPILSDKDRALPLLADAQLPRFQPQ